MTEQPDATVTPLPGATQRLHPVTLRARAGLDPDTEIIGAHQLTIEAGITYRQLDYWTRCGYLTPWNNPTPGSGVPRVYPLDQVFLAREMDRVIRAGITTPMALVHATAVSLLADGRADLGAYTLTPRQEDTA